MNRPPVPHGVVAHGLPGPDVEARVLETRLPATVTLVASHAQRREEPRPGFLRVRARAVLHGHGGAAGEGGLQGAAPAPQLLHRLRVHLVLEAIPPGLLVLEVPELDNGRLLGVTPVQLRLMGRQVCRITGTCRVRQRKSARSCENSERQRASSPRSLGTSCPCSATPIPRSHQ